MAGCTLLGAARIDWPVGPGGHYREPISDPMAVSAMREAISQHIVAL
jgi:hypothetical protein